MDDTNERQESVVSAWNHPLGNVEHYTGNDLPKHVVYIPQDSGINIRTFELSPETVQVAKQMTTGMATKHDGGKVDLSLNPLVALEEMAKAFMLGEKKYGRYNFYKGMESHRLVAAAMRHLTSWNEGESLDPESGNSHLGHVLACIAMILQQEKLGTLKDTRYKGE